MLPILVIRYQHVNDRACPTQLTMCNKGLNGVVVELGEDNDTVLIILSSSVPQDSSSLSIHWKTVFTLLTVGFVTPTFVSYKHPGPL